uniref:ATP synthase F0 subunit 8 n=2 Tax=Gracilaria tenuistipitata TaxID=2510778 RepID=A0A2S1PUR5_GRATE|nr:ATP synthase F0 subunit 8 [Gracilaria tenuistipitata]ARU07642.1 ATP synthase subunit 8 [Gracilaria tenuistipitata]AWH62568.1 ATP synthase F0 subunit 8 [Gracilaria tenuistipitata]AWH62593.1 ATP synthase F0 subunit 8 [Gracilaria tenuistipitata var. liui]AXI97786.1 ATP synthase F0 subunit 8 [Gracilaria tenuistipitata]
MPQLDRIIVFSQIFWLFLIFSLFYVVLTHYFLPMFLKSLKIRKQIIDINTQEVLEKTKQTLSKKNLLRKTLIQNLEITSNLLTDHFTQLIIDKKKIDTLSIDQKISFAILNITKFCDLKLLNSILVYPKSLKFKY